MYLEWYKDYYGAGLPTGSSALDVPHMRRALPAANCVRFVGLLWKDSVKSSDGLECFVDDESRGYLDDECMRYVDAMVKQATDAGLWVILAARAKYAAGWSGPDVWHSPTMRRQMLTMWRSVAKRYQNVDRIAGYEIMSEPRTKVVSQSKVRDFMREGCEAVHAADPGALCVVGPRPYYKLWELNDDVLQPPGSNTLYTFDFFVPKNFVMSDTQKNRDQYCNGGHEGCWGAWYPTKWPCKDVYDTWWRGQPGCHSATSMVMIDDAWMKNTLERFAVQFGAKHQVPVHCNQWGVKNEVFDQNGRLRYAKAVLDVFATHGMSSTYWIWRSMAKGGRDVKEPVWGFELAHNDGPHESLDAPMLGALQAAFVRTARVHTGTAFPCGLAAAMRAPRYNVTPFRSTAVAKSLTMSQQPPVKFAPPPLPEASSYVECNPEKLEARIDWSLLGPPAKRMAEDPQQALEHVVDEILSETSNQKAARGVRAPEASGRQAPRPLGKAAGRYASVGAELDLD